MLTRREFLKNMANGTGAIALGKEVTIKDRNNG